MRRKCDMPFNMLKIEMDGRVYMCSSGQPANINAFEVDPLEIWNSERFKELRYQLDTEQYDDMCLQCPLVQDFIDTDARVEEMRVAALNYRIVDNVVVDARRQPLAVSGRISGWVDTVDQSPKTLSMAGWATDMENGQPCKIVVVFIDGVAQAAKALTFPRGDVAAHFGNSQLKMSGYSIPVPVPAGSAPPDISVRVFAIDGDGNAAELSYSTSIALSLNFGGSLSQAAA
jgi:radical SAM protein with 4Fe4S-binding SPASM domain